ncbi:DUF4381 family protein [Cognatilysobacter bugurensis]|uniref:DUF4381 domain-containing protein n=1 Tax=Cognatilysobacter bugurensis TaxID=543356 RepID=A0A918T2D0_9GAMM|nr:DUF4381 family protein [Lysobacter bugurensis]GHA84673.1 hypothetical protein GCM10007067_23270 [Lysobacter bugurensis]
MADPTLALRDIHMPAAPPWWPPAPGWWLLAACIAAAVAVVLALRWRRRRRLAASAARFDAALAHATTPTQTVAAMSDLLRRAARLKDPTADRLQGEDWLARLDDGDAARPFSAGPGQLLLDGAFRPDVDAHAVDALRPLARARFVAWTAPR